MKKAQKENPDRNGKQNNKLLTKEERENCDEFRNCRYRYGMTQEEWAEKIGISLGLVKRIETYTIAYSKKTREKVDKFMETYEIYPNIPNMHELEELILYDIFFTHMQHLSKKDAMNYAQECTRSLRNTLLKASRCSTPDAQKIFFDFVSIFLKALSRSAVLIVDTTGKSTDCMLSTDDLVSVVEKKIKKITNQVDTAQADNKEEYHQETIFDMP